MAEHHAYEADSAPDIELTTPRAGPVRYTLALPDGPAQDKRLPGLVLFIPGFGQDNDAGYIESFTGWVADTFGFACASVAYHAHGCRPSSGASRRFTQPDADRLVHYCQQYNITVGADAKPGVLMEQLHHAVQAKATANGPSDTVTLTCGLVALGGELQNFGLIQAMDHLHVLADLRRRIDYDKRNTIAVGSSHGGYLAQLIAKLAPNTLRAVFDNSGYATPPERYINGREKNLPDYIEQYSAAMQMYFFLESMWSFYEHAPNFYHPGARAVRSLMLPAHLQTMANAGGRRTRYRCVHGPDDPIAPTQEKSDCCARLSEAGFDMQFKCMGPADVDGRYVKSLDHGMGLSLRGFFERSYASLPAADLDGPPDAWPGDDFDRGTQLVYEGPGRSYRFVFDSSGVVGAMA